MKQDIQLDALFDLVDEDRIFEFCKSYAYKNSEFAEALKKHFKKELPSPEKKMTMATFRTMIDRSFAHEYDGPSWRGSYYYEPDYLDWSAVGRDLLRVINLAETLIPKGLAQLAIDVALLMLEKVAENYSNDYCYEREDFEYEDMHTEETLGLIRSAFNSGQISNLRKLETVDKLEKIEKSEAYDYDSFGFGALIDMVREELLTDDERIAIRRRAFDSANGDYSKEDAAKVLWAYLLSLNREDEAVAFYKANSKIDGLRDKYVQLLKSQGQLDEVVKVLNEGIILAKTKDHSGTVLRWERDKLEIFEKMGNKELIVNQLKKLFVEDSRYVDYYKRLKVLVESANWESFLRELISEKRSECYSATSQLTEIYAMEEWYDDLFDALMHAQFNLLDALKLYAHLFDSEHQHQLVLRLEPGFRRSADSNMGRDKYQQLVRNLQELRSTCAPGKQLADKLISDSRVKYKNRPAMQQEMAKY